MRRSRTRSLSSSGSRPSMLDKSAQAAPQIPDLEKTTEDTLWGWIQRGLAPAQGRHTPLSTGSDGP